MDAFVGALAREKGKGLLVRMRRTARRQAAGLHLGLVHGVVQQLLREIGDVQGGLLNTIELGAEVAVPIIAVRLCKHRRVSTLQLEGVTIRTG